jgi:TatA/E family protein of Tat protein translocase
MLGSLGFPELMMIFVVALIIFGPKRLPDIGRSIGKAMGEFRRATNDLKSTLEEEVRLEERKTVAPPPEVSPQSPTVNRD